MLLNAGKYIYELVKDWAKVPPGWSFLDVCGLSIDTQDRVYVLSRSDRPVTVFDRDGNLLTSWGQGFFKHAHGSCGSPSGNVFCTDDMRHVVAEFTPEGKLLRVLGNLGQAFGYRLFRQAGRDSGQHRLRSNAAVPRLTAPPALRWLPGVKSMSQMATATAGSIALRLTVPCCNRGVNPEKVRDSSASRIACELIAWIGSGYPTGKTADSKFLTGMAIFWSSGPVSAVLPISFLIKKELSIFPS